MNRRQAPIAEAVPVKQDWISTLSEFDRYLVQNYVHRVKMPHRVPVPMTRQELVRAETLLQVRKEGSIADQGVPAEKPYEMSKHGTAKIAELFAYLLGTLKRVPGTPVTWDLVEQPQLRTIGTDVPKNAVPSN